MEGLRELCRNIYHQRLWKDCVKDYVKDYVKDCVKDCRIFITKELPKVVEILIKNKWRH